MIVTVDEAFTLIFPEPFTVMSLPLSWMVLIPRVGEAAAGRIVTGADGGFGGHVKAFTSRSLSNAASFLSYSASFSGGVRVAAGDVNGDGAPDIITGSGPGAAHVKVFSGRDQSLLHSFLAYGPSFSGGVFVAAGDVNGDGLDDIVSGTDAGAAAHTAAFAVVPERDVLERHLPAHRLEPHRLAGLPHLRDRLPALVLQLLDLPLPVPLDVDPYVTAALRLPLHGPADELLERFEGRAAAADEDPAADVDDVDECVVGGGVELDVPACGGWTGPVFLRDKSRAPVDFLNPPWPRPRFYRF